MNKKVKFFIVFVIVLALTVFLAVQVSAARPEWKHEFVELVGGGWGHAIVNRDETIPPMEYDCRPYVTIPGCNNDIPGKECYNGYFEPTFDLGIGCGMVVYWLDETHLPDYTIEWIIDFEHTVDPKLDLYPGIPGYRSGYTYSGNAVMRAYLGTYMYSYTLWPWLTQISWRNGVVVPHRVDFRYDPESPTCAESGWPGC